MSVRPPGLCVGLVGSWVVPWERSWCNAGRSVCCSSPCAVPGGRCTNLHLSGSSLADTRADPVPLEGPTSWARGLAQRSGRTILPPQGAQFAGLAGKTLHLNADLEESVEKPWTPLHSGEARDNAEIHPAISLRLTQKTKAAHSLREWGAHGRGTGAVLTASLIKACVCSCQNWP